MYKINYKEALELGFNRTDIKDSQFYSQYGYEYFYMERQLGIYSFCWDVHTHNVQLSKNANIVKVLETKEEFEFLYKLLKP
jgi:hypothetical protein